MLINLRNALMAGKRKQTAKDYVQSGLIAMWDGIENAGWGVHDANATVWKDLTGNGYDFVKIGAITRWAEDAAVFDGSNNNGPEGWNIDGILTLEVVGISELSSFFAFSLHTSGTQPRKMFSILPAGNRGFQFADSAPSMFKDWSSARWSVAATWSNSDKQDAQYYNGQFAPSNSGTSGWSVPRNSAILGRHSNDQYKYKGELCCIRAYSRALAADEIAANYAVDKARFGLP